MRSEVVFEVLKNVIYIVGTLRGNTQFMNMQQMAA